MITVNNLTYTYPGAQQETLHGLNFAIAEGEIFGFLGPSGAGKSTTQKILIGLLKEYGGSIQIMGREVSVRSWGAKSATGGRIIMKGNPMSDQMLDTLASLRMPGATLATRLKVYDTPTPDGQIGGTPHMHLLCTEMYFVTAGNGAVEFLDMRGFSIQELAPQTAVIFSPGTIHRLINPNCDLELFIIMQNSGLPERGDNVVTFADGIMQADEAYTEAMHIQTVEEAYRRRDRGVEGFLELKTAFAKSQEQGQQALQRFYAQAADRTQPLHTEWRDIVTQGALAEAQTALAHLEALAEKQTDYLAEARHFAIQPQAYAKLGFCGHLNRYFDPATLTPEGVVQE